jgi:hypothetical protein
MVKPEMKRPRKRLKMMAIGNATNTTADCQKKTSPRISSVGTPDADGLLRVFHSSPSGQP